LQANERIDPEGRWSAPMASADHEQVVQTVADEEFRAFCDLHFSAVYRYFCRRVQDADVGINVADVFLVAWRRFAELPPTSHERTLWLFGVARRVLSDNRKADSRRQRLAERIRSTGSEEYAHPGPDIEMSWSDATSGGRQAGEDADVADRVAIAIRRLRPHDQEALKLNLWEQLTDAEGAHVMGCSVNAFRLRLYRARKRLAANYASVEVRPDVGSRSHRPRQGGTRD
jgi:RNA polymerase sigma factor (sigma-70 family)